MDPAGGRVGVVGSTKAVGACYIGSFRRTCSGCRGSIPVVRDALMIEVRWKDRARASFNGHRFTTQTGNKTHSLFPVKVEKCIHVYSHNS